MNRLMAVAVAAMICSPVALAQDGMSRPGADAGSGGAEAPTRTEGRRDTGGSDGSVADVAEDLGIDTSACNELLVPTHRDIVELRYIAEALPPGSLKREFAGRLDRMEEDTASALGSLCGVRNLDRTPPSRFTELDLGSIAGTVGTVFGNEVQVSDSGFVVQVVEAALDLAGQGRTSRRDRRIAEERSMARAAASDMDDESVEALVARVRAAPFAEEKIAVLEAGAAGKRFTSAQVATLVKAMPFAEQRVPVALYLYTFTTDQGNFDSTVVSALPFAGERSELRAALAAR